MTSQVLRAAAGGLAGAACLALVLVLSPWRPDGLLVGTLIALGGLPYATALGVRLALRGATGEDGEDGEDVRLMAKVAGLGAPVLLVLLLFTILAVAGNGRAGVQQVLGLLLAAAASSALAARFTSSLAWLADSERAEG